MPPEEWIQDFEYLPTKVDMWAIGTVFYSMLAKNLLWNSTKDTDLHYQSYLKRREAGFPQFEVLDNNYKELLYCLLDPVASNRIEAPEVLEKQWVKEIRVCRGEYANHHHHS